MQATLLTRLVVALLLLISFISTGSAQPLTAAQTAQVQGGPFIFAINGPGDTGTSSNPANWSSPLWTAITGNSAFPGPPVGGTAGSSPYHYLLDPALGHDVWDTYRPLPAGQPMLDLLFAVGTTPGPPAGSGAALPSGYLHTVGNQIVDGSGNNVRLSCTGYNAPTANVSSDMTVIRNQSFNCVRVPYYDAITCPGGACNFTAADQIVAAATASNLKVVFDHHGNETSCGAQQGNGLWYDVNGSVAAGVTWSALNSNTDGCSPAHAGTVNYAAFKANITAFATHYKGNATVIGFDLDNEPIIGTSAVNFQATPVNWGGVNGADVHLMCQDVGAAVEAADPGALIFCEGPINPSGPFLATAGAPVSGSFSTSSTGQIIAPNGQPWIGVGINLGDFRAGLDMAAAVTNFTTAAPLTTLFPHINYVRLALYGGGAQGALTAYPAPSSYDAFVNSVTALGIVVEMEHHVETNGSTGGGGQGTVPAPGDPWLVAETNNYAALAAHFKNNPYVWFGSTNEPPSLTGLSQWQQTTYNAIRGTGNNNPVMFEVWGSRPPGYGGTTMQAGMVQSIYTAMHNVIWDPHQYGFINNNNTSQAVNNQTSADIIAVAKTITSGDGTMPVMIGEYGTSTTGSSLDANGTQNVTAVLQSGVGSGAWHWGNQDCCNNLNNGNTLTAYGSQVAAGIFAHATPFTPGGAAGFPVSGAAKWMDLSLAGSQPVVLAGDTGSHVVYSVHHYPTGISGTLPDSGPNAVTMHMSAWGYLVAANTAPVWIGAMGASLDNSNGQISDETAWATTLTQLMNGQAAGQGGFTFTGCQQPIGSDWWNFGNNAGQQPDGTLNADGSNKSGQQAFWGTLLYTTCSTPLPSATIWNPADILGLTLSNNNLTATSSGLHQGVRSNTSLSTGKICFAVTATAITPNWDVGLANSTFALNASLGLGGDGNGIGFDPLSGPAQGIFYNNVILSNGAGTSASGEEQDICADLGAHLFWASNGTMRGHGFPWNNSATASPATATGGLSFAGLTCPCFITFNADETGAVALLNAPGPMAVALPAGFAFWQASTPPPSSNTTRPFVLILGANENFSPYGGRGGD